MSPEAQNRAIAKACGPGWSTSPDGKRVYRPNPDRKAFPDNHVWQCQPLSDLNAMAEAVVSQGPSFNAQFAEALEREAGRTKVYQHSLVAGDWARIFLRTLNLWDDSK